MPIVSTGKESRMSAVNAVVSRLKTSIAARFHLALENLALRQQLKVWENAQSYVNATACFGFCFLQSGRIGVRRW